MKHIIKAVLILFVVLANNDAIYGQNSTIKLDIRNAESGTKVILQKYSGLKQLKTDSLQVEVNTEMNFGKDKPLLPGMYSITNDKKLLANFFISNPEFDSFTISLDIENPAQTLVFAGSPENQAFIDYLRFLNANQQKGEQAEMVIRQKGKELQKQFPGTMLALFIKSLSQSEIPEPAITVANKQEYTYYYMANHFFDNIDFSDSRLLKTPILEQKLGSYFRQIAPPVADSIKIRVTEVLAKARANDEVYNWAVKYLYQLYRESPIQDNSQVYNFIGEQFILNEPKRWNDTAFVEKVRERVANAKLNPVGAIATNLKLQTPEGKTSDLYSIEASKTILLFFNPGCEACHAVTEELFAIYQQYKAKGIQVYAVYTDRNTEEWKNYISAKGLDWINVFDPTGEEEIDRKYDIFAIPLIYMLDKDKKILAKDIPVNQLNTYLK